MTTISVPEGRLLPILAGAAAGVVLATVLLFSLVGAVRGTDDAGDATAAAATSAPSDEADGATGGDGEDGAAPAAGGGTESDAPGSEAESPTDGEASEPAGDGATTPSDEPPDEPSDDPSVDPGEISIQVLDAVGDGGAAAQALADELEDAGFNVIVVNGASRGYDATTVFWTEGQGPGGRAVAAAIGTDVASRTPDAVRLSDSVDVHVVVGADRG